MGRNDRIQKNSQSEENFVIFKMKRQKNRKKTVKMVTEWLELFINIFKCM